MSVLTTPQLIEYLAKPILGERLVVTPLIEPHNSISESAIDVRLGNQFILIKRRAFPCLDRYSQRSINEYSRKYPQRIIVNYRTKFYLHPGELVLGSTFEYIKLPSDLMSYVVGKSTWGRMGLIIATATKIDPGFRGCVTLEIINEGEVPIALVPGELIAQLVFHKVTSNITYKGMYKCPIGPQFPRFNSDKNKLPDAFHPKEE